MNKPQPETGLPPQIVDLEIPNGCPLCGGPVSLRLHPDGAVALCRPCRYFGAPELRPRGGGNFELSFSPHAEA